jgi:hypothetical protein
VFFLNKDRPLVPPVPRVEVLLGQPVCARDHWAQGKLMLGESNGSWIG